MTSTIVLMIFRLLAIAYISARLFIPSEFFHPGAWIDFIVMIFVIANLILITFHEINDPENHIFGR